MNTKNTIYYLILFTCGVLFLPSCSTKKKSWISRSYHNITAKYNQLKQCGDNSKCLFVG